MRHPATLNVNGTSYPLEIEVGRRILVQPSWPQRSAHPLQHSLGARLNPLLAVTRTRSIRMNSACSLRLSGARTRA